MLEARHDGHLYVGEIPQKWTASDNVSTTSTADPTTTDMHDAGLIGEQATPILGVRTIGEDVIVWTQSEVKVCCRRLWFLPVHIRASLTPSATADPSTSGPEGSRHEDIAVH